MFPGTNAKPSFRIALSIIAVLFLAFFHVGLFNWINAGHDISHAWQSLTSDWLLLITFIDAGAFTLLCLAWLYHDLRKSNRGAWQKVLIFVGTIVWGVPVFLLYLAWWRQEK